MDEIIEMRMWWAGGVVLFGGLLPFFTFCMYYSGKKINAYALVAFFAYYVLFFNYARDIIPEKYDTKIERVYQCGYVDKMVPKYPDGIVK